MVCQRVTTSPRGPEHGAAQVFIDSELVETVSCRAGASENMQELFVRQGLEFGPHTIEIRLQSENASEQPGVVGIDAFDVLPLTKAPQ